MPQVLERTTVFYEGLDHPEGLAVHPDGCIWAGSEAGQIYRISEDGQILEEVANIGGFNLGIAVSPGAEWLAICDLGNYGVWKLNMKGIPLASHQKK